MVSFVKFNVDNSENSVCSLNISKSLDYENLCIAHIIYSDPAIYMFLFLFYNAMVMHNYEPNCSVIGIVISTVKNVFKSVGDVLNYSPISIMPVIEKIFKKCLAEIIEPYFNFYENQFGFVENGGCN